MAAVLQPAISNPFDTTPGPPSCRLEGPFSFPEYASDLDTVSLRTFTRDQKRQLSPTSMFSIASAPTNRNNENNSPLFRLKKAGLQLRSVSAQSSKPIVNDPSKIYIRPRNFTYRPLIPDVNPLRRGQELECQVKNIGLHEAGITATLSAQSPTSDVVLRAKVIPTTPKAACNLQNQLHEHTVAKTKPLNYSHSAVSTPETGVLSRIRALRQNSLSRDHGSGDISPTHTSGSIHQHQISESSSGFVHSMKTASFTNGSFSIFPRSSRIGKSTDSYTFGSQYRHSIDSDRTISSYSFDDLAIRRAFKRQQIIDELISTEESYIADLKALVYLYSTLLASTSSIPNRLRAAIEGNVDQILHSHVGMLAKLHNARLQAAARRWADTVVPAKLGHHRRTNLRHSE